MENVSLREKKKAILKNQIMEEMLRLLSIKELNKISLEELCENINVSKVTFFKYFKYKEQVLDYFVYKWQYDRSYDIRSQTKKGIDGLLDVFNSISNEEIGQKFMISLIHYYSKITEKPSIEITDYEYYLFNKKAFIEETKPLNLKDIFLYYISDINEVPCEKYNDIINQLVALMYGVPIKNHITGQSNISYSYEIGVKSIIGIE